MGLGALTDVGKQQTISLERYDDLIKTEAKYYMMVRYLQDSKSKLNKNSLLEILGEDVINE